MALSNNVVIRLRGDISDFQAKMVTAGKSVGNVADKMTGAEKESQKFRKGLNDLGSAGGKVGLAAAAGIAVAVKAFADFDQAMSGVAAATHASRQEMEQLRGLALQTGADTAFSAVEAADGIEQLAKAGVTTADIMGGGLQGALDLAAAGTIEVGMAAETAATAMTQFGLTGDRVPHIADLLAAAAGKAQGEVSDMAYALQQSGLVADQMGLSIEETTGALAAFASAGLLGSDAGTSFKTMLMRLVPDTEKAATAMEEIGFNAFDAQGNMKSLTEIAGNLQEGLRDMSAEQRQATLKNLFGQDAIRAATVLYEQGADGIQAWIDAVNDQGYAAETAAIKMDNLAGDVEKLRGALSTLFIEGGAGGNDFLRGATQNAEQFVTALAEMPDWASSAAMSLAGITAITGGGLWFGSKVITGVADTREALKNLRAESEMAGRALGAVGTALKVTAILEGLNLLDEAINKTFDQRLDESNLTRSLRALAQGRVEGEVLDQYGEDLKGFVDDVDLATSKWTTISRLSMKIPLGGDFIAGDTADALRDFEKLDRAFASLVESGDADAAASMFDKLAGAAVAAGYDLADVADLFPQYEIALDNAANDARDFGVAQRGVAGALDESTGPGGRATRALEDIGRAAADAAGDAADLSTAVEDLKATLEGRQANRAYEQSLDDFSSRLKERRDLIDEIAQAERDVANADTKESKASAQDRLDSLKEQLKDFKLTLDEGTQAGRDWNTSLEAIAMNATEAGSKMEGMDRVKYLNNARRDFIDLATKITGSREEAKLLADDLGLVHHTPVKPKVNVDTKPAKDEVGDLIRWIEEQKIHLWLDPAIRKNAIDAEGGEKAGQPPNRSGRGFAVGGYTGDYPVQQVAGVVHGREFVHDAQTTAMFRPLFEYIHQNRRLPGYREGGYVAAQTSTSNNYYGADIDYDRLTAAILRARPLYGPVTVQGDGSFRREMRADARRASSGGVNF